MWLLTDWLMFPPLKRIILISQSLMSRSCTEDPNLKLNRKIRENRLAKFILGASISQRRDGLQLLNRLSLTAKAGEADAHSLHSIYLKEKMARKSIIML